MDEFQRAGHHTGNLDKILQAALEFDLHQVIKDSRYWDLFMLVMSY